MSIALIRRRLADVRRAMATAERQRQEIETLRRASASTRDPKHLIGRWALPSGAAFKVRDVDETTGRALCGNGASRWFMLIAELHRMLERRQLRFLGRIRR